MVGRLLPSGLPVLLFGMLASSLAGAQIVAEPRLVAPERLVIGEHKSVDVEAVGFATSDEIELFSSCGSLSPVTADGSRSTFRFTLPQEKYPQAAIVAAISRDRKRFAYRVIQLVAQPTVRVKSEPWTQIKVVVAGRTFGPTQTDGRGQATLRVQVPPGTQAGETIATDRAGNASSESLLLASPDYRRTVIACPAVGEQVLVLAVDPAGRPADVAPALSASVGQLVEVASPKKGVFVARLVVDEQSAGKHTTLKALASDARGNLQEQSASCSAPLPKVRPVALAVRLSQAAYVAGSKKDVQVEVELAYPPKRQPREEKLTVAVDMGVVSELVRQKRDSDAHVYVATWRIADRFSGKKRARVTVRGETETLRASESLGLLPGSLVRLRASAPQTTVLADGKASIRISVVAKDEFDNPVAGLRVVPRAPGRVSTAVEQRPGTHVFLYTPRVSHKRGTDAVSFVADGAEKPVEAALTIGLRASRRPFSVSAAMGVESNLGRLVGPALILDAAYRLPVWQRRASIGLRTGYFTASDKRVGSDGNDPVDVSVRSTPLLFSPAIEWSAGKIRTRGGVLAGVLLAERSVASPDLGKMSFTSPRFAWGAQAGASLALGPGRVSLDLMFLFARANDAVLSGNLGGLFFTGGYQIDL